MSTVISPPEAGQTNRPSETRRGDSSPDVLENQALFAPVEAFLSRSGKRIRDSLVHLSYRIAGGAGEPPECLGKAIELLHAGSLVIDDIQDDSHSRRDRPTLHREIGLPLAINAGNWMYFAALEKITRSDLTPRLQHRLVTRMISAGRHCHEGQALDLAARVDQVKLDELGAIALSISRQKTGRLVSLATQFGSLAAGADLNTRRALSRFGMEIGVALQMRNDLDELASLCGDRHESIRCDDLMNARVTWPWAWAARYGRPDEVDRCIGLLIKCPNDSSAMVQVATRLLDIVSVKGNQIIRWRIDRQIDRLRLVSHDTEAVNSLNAALLCISGKNRTRERNHERLI